MHEGHRKRLIQKLLDNKEILSDHELLEILLFFSIPRKNVNEESHRLIDEFGCLKNVLSLDNQTLSSIDGIGEKSAIFLTVIGEIYNRIKQSEDNFPIIYNYENSKDYFVEVYKNIAEEVFSAFYLDSKGKVMMRKIFCSHSDNEVDVELKALLKGTATIKPNSIIICHNHLSDSVMPSQADDKATAKIVVALDLLGIKMNDHIIVNKKQTYSYRSSGRLDKILKMIKYNV